MRYKITLTVTLTLCRNDTHNQRQVELKKLRQRLAKGVADKTELKRYDLANYRVRTQYPSHRSTFFGRFRKLTRQSTRPNGQLVNDMLAWIKTKKKHITSFGAPWQADAQVM